MDTDFVRCGFGLVVVVTVLSLAAVGCGASHRVGTRAPRLDLSIVTGAAEPALPFVLGDTFRFAARRSYRLAGYGPREDCDSVVLSPNGRYLLYGVSREEWPALELLDLASDTRRLFRAHACDPVWNRNGQIAYIHYLVKPRGEAYSVQTLVQQGPGGTPSAWTQPGSWTEPIWAGDDLLLDSAHGVVVLYGAGQERGVDGYPAGPLGPVVRVVAVSPQGGRRYSIRSDWERAAAALALPTARPCYASLAAACSPRSR